MMRTSEILISALLLTSTAAAQTIAGIGGLELGHTRLNGAMKERFHAMAPQPNVVVFTGDRVIPHFIDGQSWQTAITVVNLENHATSFDVLFFQDDGSDLYVPVVGLGVVRGVNVSLATAGTLTFETDGTNPALGSGWALLSQPNNDSVGSFAVFRYSLKGAQPQEAVVPTVNQFYDHFVLPFDNSGQLVTGVALANPTVVAVSITVTIRNQRGEIIDKRLLSLRKYEHQAFVLPTTWTSTVGIRGTIEFQTTGFGVGALGIRANGNAFTTLNVLSNFNWIAK
jgi:hypothetical protein